MSRSAGIQNEINRCREALDALESASDIDMAQLRDRLGWGDLTLEINIASAARQLSYPVEMMTE